jgi:D-arabinose 5-phosphate isomerase GutQ/sugar/nucleoside kinase (ribokinase family)
MSTAIKRVMGIGSNVVDVIARVNQIAGPEEKTYILPHDDGTVIREVVGGVTLNHLAWARLLGTPVGLFGYQGDDRYGTIIRATMDRHRIGREHVKVLRDTANGFSVIYVDPEAERCIYMFRGPSATTTPEHIRSDFADAIRNAGMVSTEISQLRLDTVIEVLKIANEAGVLTFLDVDVPPDFCVNVARLGTLDELEEALSLASILKPAKAAASQITGHSVAERQAEALLRRFHPKLVAITDGRRGSVFADNERMIRMPAKEVQAVDSTGAGDAFLGGLITGLYHRLDIENVARLANACGGACCKVVGAFPSLGHSRRDVMSLYEDEWPLAVDEEPPAEERAHHVAVRVLRDETDALETVTDIIDVAPVEQAAQRILISEMEQRRVHVTGVGKCRFIAQKLAATLKSIGTGAYFLDPLDAVHGDSGGIASRDVVVAFSQSGKTAELLAAIRVAKRLGADVIAVTGSDDSPLAAESAIVIHVPVDAEADPLGLAPTSSTTCQLAVADALAMTVASVRGTRREDFAKFHPGGALGEKLRT